MRLINRKDMEFLKPQRRVKEEERFLIKESEKTKLFVNKDGCYISNSRQDTGEYREYDISSLIEIREETVPINEKDEYIILYENSKGEDILVSGKKNRDYGQGKFRIGKSVKMITQKGLQLVYNLSTKVLYERKTTLKHDFLEEEKSISLSYDNINLSFSNELHEHFRQELNNIKIERMQSASRIKWTVDPIIPYIGEPKISKIDEQPTIK